MNAKIISKAALEAVKEVAQILPQVAAKLGPEAWARASVIRNVGKAAPWVVKILGVGGTYAIMQLSRKDYVRVGGRHGNAEIIVEASSSRKKKKKTQAPTGRIHSHSIRLQ